MKQKKTTKAPKDDAPKKAPPEQAKFKLDDDLPVITREEIELPHALAATEVAHISDRNAQVQGQIEQIDKEIADYTKPRRAQIKALEKELSEGSLQVRTKTRYILVPVKIEHDYKMGHLRYYRLDRGERDKGELYDTKPMDPAERERAIFEPPADAERLHVQEDDGSPPPEVQA